MTGSHETLGVRLSAARNRPLEADAPNQARSNRCPSLGAIVLRQMQSGRAGVGLCSCEEPDIPAL